MNKWYKCEFYNHGITFTVNVLSDSPETAKTSALEKIEREINFDITWNEFGYEESITELQLEEV